MPTVAEARPDLAASVAEARRVEQPLARRVAELEAELAAAVDRGDYAGAATLKEALPQARESAAIAAAHTAALQAAIARLEEQRRADLELIETRRRRDQAERDLEAARSAKADAASEIQRHIATAGAGIDAVRESWRLAQQVEQAVVAAHQAEWDNLRILGHVPDDQRPPYPPRAANAILDRDPVLRMVVLGRCQCGVGRPVGR